MRGLEGCRSRPCYHLLSSIWSQSTELGKQLELLVFTSPFQRLYRALSQFFRHPGIAAPSLGTAFILILMCQEE